MKAFNIIGLLTLTLWAHHALAQDLRFTQSNAIPTIVNPAFAGSSDDARVSSVYRNQWASMPGSYVAMHVAHDWYNRNLNSGFGILFSNEEAGAGGLSTTRIAGQFAYEVPLGNGWRLRPALQAGLASRSIQMQVIKWPMVLVAHVKRWIGQWNKNEDPMTNSEFLELDG